MDDELEQRIAEMSDADFDKLVARTRPPRLDELRAAERRGDWQRSFALKARRLNQLMNPKTEEQN